MALVDPGTKRPTRRGTAPVAGASASKKKPTETGADPWAEMLAALRAVEAGDFSVRLPVSKGRKQVAAQVPAEVASAFNAVAARNELLAHEMRRVEGVVGREGRMTERASLGGEGGAVSGGWAVCVGSINALIGDLVQPTTEVARVLIAVAEGDLTQKMALEIEGQSVKGEFLRIGTAVNSMVDQLSNFAAEVTRVAKEVGTEGKLGGQAAVPGAAGIWRDLTDNVNQLANNLTAQVRNIAEVTTSVAKGDLSKKITVDARGEVLELKDTINTMVDQLNSFAAEVTRVAKEVGTEGKLGGQAEVKGVSGTWKDLTDNVNFMATNLTTQVRGIARVVTAVANGDLSQRLKVEAKGEIAQLADTINAMTGTLGVFAEQVTGVARTVGVEGKLGAQAEVPGVAGTWKDLTENVNLLANNLTAQVRNIAEVTTSVAKGDLSKKITVDARGEILEVKNTVNTMVDQLNSFAAEVTRVAKEVGTEGKLGGQAEVRGVSGTWKDLTDNVNSMASNLTGQVRNIALVTTAVANGDLSKKITVDVKGELLELKNTVNTMVDQLNSFASEVTRVAREVGTEGRLGGQAEVQGVAGIWKNLTDNVNFMARNLTTQVRGIVRVVTAVANGDLRQKLVVDAAGEVAALAETINNMTDTLGVFAEQVSTVAREVGVEGKLGGQARVPGVAGTWKDLTDNVNFMASNLTTQVRGIVKVVTAVADGDVSQKLIGVEAKGEIAALAETINNMCDTLGTFSDQVTTVAREVGIEGKLGGQAKVPGARGTWRQLTDNVNQLAGNLTTQVRAISEVATAVTKGDLTRSIDVVAAGEVASLKDNINQMIVNLKETTQKNTEQDWLKTNLARFSSMMQGQKNLRTVSSMIMSELTPLVSAHHGAFFLMNLEATELRMTSSYAYRERKNVSNKFQLGEGLVGQCALEKKSILLTNVPSDYIQISSGLGEAPPLNIIVLPVLFEGEVKAVIELASFHAFSVIHRIFLDQLTETIGVVLNMINASMRTEELLAQSQTLTQELQTQSRELTIQQNELKQSNTALEQQAVELEEKARLLEEQNAKVEVKNREVELARGSLEEKAEQLARASKYKSEFLANMSHELRTPLNSLLILARILAENPDANLSEKQVEFAQTIYTSGGDLLSLINEILDLSKVEAGKMEVEPRTIQLAALQDFVVRSFQPVADQKGVSFTVFLSPDAPEVVRTDPQRLQQVLKNLLSNAFKFTEHGGVTLTIGRPSPNTRLTRESLNDPSTLLAFTVQDTGIGIPADKQQLIFEAFQQADGTTNRRYGGTGLGLSISREITRLLGGEIQVASTLGAGSTFTLYLPEIYVDEDAPEGSAYQPQPDSDRLTTTTFRPLAEVGISPIPGADLLLSRPVEDDRAHIRPGDRVVLIIEDDLNFARIMVNLARENHFRAVVATRGDTGLALANELIPDAITLDIQLPVIDGFRVLDRLKRSARTRHIPVHVISVMERSQKGAALGAFAFLEKPVNKEAIEGAFAHLATFLEARVRQLLLVEDDATEQSQLMEVLGAADGDVQITAVSTAQGALEELETKTHDCMVVDLFLPELEGIRLIEEVKTQPRFADMPVVVYTNKDLTESEDLKLKKYAQSVILKAGPLSKDRLIEDTSLFLHRVAPDGPKRARPTSRELAMPPSSGAGLHGRTVLVVDDDIRNIYAMTSLLEPKGLRVVFAENGRAALEKLEEHPEVSVVLLDIMMPEMDGFETMRRIRADARWKSLPIMAVTAKALKEDRHRCLEAGASDYLPKPVDTERLFELLTFWIGQD
jgi:signal transduction histidine kinase/CheY-like chemotaxis protein/HAMP domain-containing protein